jgi:general secretion pathway protein K
LYACIGSIDQASAQRLVAARSAVHFKSLSDASNALGNRELNLVQEEHGINSRFFEMRAYLRINNVQVQEYSVVQRDGLTVKTLWRQKGAVSPQTPLQ